jgi:hypothetical protein
MLFRVFAYPSWNHFPPLIKWICSPFLHQAHKQRNQFIKFNLASRCVKTVYEPQLLKIAQTGLLHVLLVPRMELVVQKHCIYMWNLNDIPCSSCILSFSRNFKNDLFCICTFNYELSYNFLGKPTIQQEDFQNSKDGDHNYYKFKNERLM